MTKKVLIIRFSSFGDIVQCMSALPALKEDFSSEIHWVTRSDMEGLLKLTPMVDRVWSFDRKSGLLGLIKLGLKLRAEKFTHIYDAHSNIRSRILCTILFSIPTLRRSKERWKRFLLFKLRKNTFEWPYKGVLSYLRPLKSWNISNIETLKSSQWSFDRCSLPKEFDSSRVLLAPSAAWEMKRWPLEHWKKLIELNPNLKFNILGGPSDSFCQELEDMDPTRVSNFAGKLSLIESCYSVAKSPLIVSADTGLIHVADHLNVKGISLIGPTAFGFVTGDQIETLSVELDCRPCTKDGRGKCSQDVWRKCMVDITPERVSKSIASLLYS
ncbi:glycosyltransferase family 9 protein [Halobacteriovorax sp. HLS]|uniref:glycosyltransferase family 9 protein n=1 Tax=Halobacteriovorax sp. HLS TaxID=2234000 RepID=UPI000FDC8907|nr:glycosyltransferase family 9 protein [Halobacteriovorax sp. HLS]